MNVKPGYATTEWWTTLGAHVIAIVALFHTATASSWAQAAVGIAVAFGPELGAAIYSHSRSRLKAVAVAIPSSDTAPVSQTPPVAVPDEAAIQAAVAAVTSGAPPAPPEPVPPVPPVPTPPPGPTTAPGV